MVPMKWPLEHVVEIHPGKDGKVCVATIETAKGRYKHPVVKTVPLVHIYIKRIRIRNRAISAGGMFMPA